MPRGGARAGAGRKPKGKEGLLTGSRRVRDRLDRQQQTEQAPAEAEAVDPVTLPPEELTIAELAVWNDLAPIAAKAKTLDETTRTALRDLCELIVLRKSVLRKIHDTDLVHDGEYGLKANPLLPQYRGLVQRIEAYMTRFKLAPMGKEISKPDEEKPVDGFAEFDDAPRTTVATH